MSANEMLINISDILTVVDVADVLRTTKQNVYKMIRSGVIRSVKVGREYRIPKLYLLEFLQGAA